MTFFSEASRIGDVVFEVAGAEVDACGIGARGRRAGRLELALLLEVHILYSTRAPVIMDVLGAKRYITEEQ